MLFNRAEIICLLRKTNRLGLEGRGLIESTVYPASTSNQV